MPDWRAKEARPVIVEGTKWVGFEHHVGSEARPYGWDLRMGGALAYDSHTGHWENGSWSCDGATLLIETNDHYADYVGYVRPDEVRGVADNVNGSSWSWWGVLK